MLPYFCAVPQLVGDTDDVAVMPEALAEQLAAGTTLRVIHFADREKTGYTPHLIRHRRIQADPGMQWVRSQIFVAAKEGETA